MSLVREQGFPKTNKSGSDDSEVIVDQYFGSYEDVAKAYREDYKIGTEGDFGYIGDVKIEPSETTAVWRITITYSGTDATVSSGASRKEPKCFLIPSAAERPIETHPNYKVCWNYYTAVNETLSGTDEEYSPSYATYEEWYNSEGKYKPQPPGGANPDKFFRFFRTSAECYFVEKNEQGTLEKWKKLADPKYPGIDSYVVPAFEIVDIYTVKTQKDAYAFTGFMGQIVKPPQTFGIEGGEWLEMSPEIQPVGRKWEIRRTYKHSPTGWVAEIYKAAENGGIMQQVTTAGMKSWPMNKLTKNLYPPDPRS